MQAKGLMTSVIWPDTLYFGTLELHFENISGLRTYIFKKRRPYLQNYRLFKLSLEIKKPKITIECFGKTFLTDMQWRYFRVKNNANIQ